MLQSFDTKLIRTGLGIFALSVVSACTTVGPDYVAPELQEYADWNSPLSENLSLEQARLADWWTLFEDDELSTLVNLAIENNNNAEIAAIRVLESRAILGASIGNRYPQGQIAFGDATYIDPAETAGSGDPFAQYNFGASIGWEPDFWGKFQRSIEASDAAFLGSIAAYDQTIVLLIAQVVDSYTLGRSIESQLLIAEENLVLQQRSYDIAETLFNNGEDSELDMMQARTLLLSTQSTVPALEAQLQKILNALNILLGRPPGPIPEISDNELGLPVLPEQFAIGLPSDVLRLRPDVRLAELQAMGQNAQVGVATANLYPSFTLGGSISLTAGSPIVDSNFKDLFSGDAISWAAGPSFTWPFLNYDRIRNNIRIQDARLQQSLVNYRETVIQAAREAEDALASFHGLEIQTGLLEQTVESAQRSNNLSMLRYREGLSSYERVLDSQKSLFTQQQRLIDSQTNEVRSIISLYKALGAGWQSRTGLPGVDEQNIQQMQERTDWGDLLEPVEGVPDDAGIRSSESDK